MTASVNVTFWAYNWYLMNNPYKDNLTKQDIHDMAVRFAYTNQDEVTSYATGDPGGTYTGIEWPDLGGGTSSITAVGNSSTNRLGSVSWDVVDPASKVTLDQAVYPGTPGAMDYQI